jgi:hypothetical protein
MFTEDSSTKLSPIDPMIESLLGADVVDTDGTSFGTLQCIWADADGAIAFAGIKTAASSTHTSIVPAAMVEPNCTCLRVATHRDLVQHGPSLSCDESVLSDLESAVHDYYGTPQPVQIRRGVLRKTFLPPARD